MTRKQAVATMPAGYRNVAAYVATLRGNTQICRNMIKLGKRVEFHQEIINRNTVILCALTGGN